MTEPTHHQIASYLINYALSELVKCVMEDTGCSIEEANCSELISALFRQNCNV